MVKRKIFVGPLQRRGRECVSDQKSIDTSSCYRDVPTKAMCDNAVLVPREPDLDDFDDQSVVFVGQHNGH